MSTARPIPGVFLLVFLAAIAAPRTLADARESYRQGLEALDADRFVAATEYFRAAIAGNGEERSGGVFKKSYFPHYYLGVALAATNDCREALAAWAESEHQGAILEDDDLSAALTRDREECRGRIERLDNALATARRAIQHAEKAVTEVERLAATDELASIWDEGDAEDENSFAARQAAAIEQLEDAKVVLRGARQGRDPKPFRGVEDFANRAAEALDLLAAEARQRQEEILDAESDALSVLAVWEQRGHREVRTVRRLDDLPPELARHVEEVSKLLDETTTRKATASRDELLSLRQRLISAIEKLSRAAQDPPDILREAASAYLHGDYEGTLVLLDGEYPEGRPPEGKPRIAAQVCLLRAAARHALFALSGGQDPGLEAALIEDVRACRSLDEPPILSETFFSPRFRSYYETVPDPSPLASPPSEIGESDAGDAGDADE